LAALAAAIGVTGVRAAAAEDFHPFAGVPASSFFPEASGYRAAPGGPPALDEAVAAAAPPKRPMLDTKTVLISAGILAAIPIGGYYLWWQGNDFTHFKFAHEGWFG